MSKDLRFLRELPESIQDVTDTDILLIAQPDNTTESKYRTVNTDVLSMYNTIINSIVTDGVGGIIHVQEGDGLVGDGTTSRPIALNEGEILKRIVPSNAVNLSQIGSLRDSSLPITTSGFDIIITKPIRCFFNGIVSTIAPQQIALSSIATPVTSRTFYIYAVSEGENIAVTGYDAPQAEGVDFTLIAVVKTNATAIYSTLAVPFIRLDKYRISNKPLGSAIPVSSGFPFNLEYTLWE